MKNLTFEIEEIDNGFLVIEGIEKWFFPNLDEVVSYIKERLYGARSL